MEKNNVEENIKTVETPVTEEPKKQPVENKQKNNKPLLIVLVIIFVGLAFGCGICLGKQLYETDEKSNEPTNDETIESDPSDDEEIDLDVNDSNETIDNSNDEKIVLDVNDSLVKKMINIFGYNCELLGEKLNKSNAERLAIAYENIEKKYVTDARCITQGAKGVLYNSDQSIKAYCGPLMSSEMQKLYYSGDTKAFEEEASKNITNVVHEENLKNKYTELFSSSYEYKSETFGGCSFMEYNSSNKNYAQYSMECGGTCGEEKQEITSAYKQGNKLYIETNYEKENDKIKVNYEFVLENGSYKFLKVTETK